MAPTAAWTTTITDWKPKEYVDCIVTNPPFGGMEEDGIEANFPSEFRTRETADLFLVLTHDPVVISGLVRTQVFLANGDGSGRSTFEHPIRHPRGQGIANLPCSSEFFGLPSSLDKKTQGLMDERLKLSLKESLTEEDKQRLRDLNQKLEILQPGISERDPAFVAFLRSRYEAERGSE